MDNHFSLLRGSGDDILDLLVEQCQQSSLEVRPADPHQGAVGQAGRDLVPFFLSGGDEGEEIEKPSKPASESRAKPAKPKPTPVAAAAKPADAPAGTPKRGKAPSRTTKSESANGAAELGLSALCANASAPKAVPKSQAAKSAPAAKPPKEGNAPRTGGGLSVVLSSSNLGAAVMTRSNSSGARLGGSAPSPTASAAAARWAGPDFKNAPAPASLPMPSFMGKLGSSPPEGTGAGAQEQQPPAQQTDSFRSFLPQHANSSPQLGFSLASHSGRDLGGSGAAGGLWASQAPSEYADYGHGQQRAYGAPQQPQPAPAQYSAYGGAYAQHPMHSGVGAPAPSSPNFPPPLIVGGGGFYGAASAPAGAGVDDRSSHLRAMLNISGAYSAPPPQLQQPQQSLQPPPQQQHSMPQPRGNAQEATNALRSMLGVS